MSHFTVLIVGEDPEKQLAPFDENIEIPKYSKGNVSEEEKQCLIDFYCTFNPEKDYGTKSEEESELNKTLSFDELYEKYGENWNSNTWEKNSEGVWVKMSTYNPNSKWDWYELGGRWRGFFHKKGTDEKFDQLLKGEINFDRMRKEVEDDARDKYIVEEYIQNAINNAISTFAVLKDGEWYEKGKMGWWGCISNEKPYWSKDFNKLMDSVPDDELISLYDCHI